MPHIHRIPMPENVSADRRPLRALLLYLLAVFAGGALLAPWLYHAVQWLARETPALAGIAKMPFSRYVNRGILIVAVLGLPWFVRASGIRRWSDVGLDPRHPRWRRFAAGFALGLVSLAVVCTVAVAAGAREVQSHPPGRLASRLAGALLTALIVCVVEELLFRGAIFGGLRRSVGWKAAMAASSAVYAIVHFMGKPDAPGAVAWDSGLRVMPSMLRGMTELHGLVPGFLNLTLAGVILALAYHATGDLFTSMGIHAGWIFWLKFYGYLTRGVPGANEWVWGTSKLIDGWFAFAALVVVLTAVAVLLRRASPESTLVG
ncbi:MAG TPA: CPBP family intramembrane glutamic endopeptidase [Longimicrobiaceae bacterium]|jgi:membrane protease YdiL (CAAX protease family)|nr:CPBP family intramembrane glutamic endopeptidase [Longimicrobiaceae bacterium]